MRRINCFQSPESVRNDVSTIVPEVQEEATALRMENQVDSVGTYYNTSIHSAELIIILIRLNAFQWNYEMRLQTPGNLFPIPEFTRNGFPLWPQTGAAVPRSPCYSASLNSQLNLKAIFPHKKGHSLAHLFTANTTCIVSVHSSNSRSTATKIPCTKINKETQPWWSSTLSSLPSLQSCWSPELRSGTLTIVDMDVRVVAGMGEITVVDTIAITGMAVVATGIADNTEAVEETGTVDMVAVVDTVIVAVGESSVRHLMVSTSFVVIPNLSIFFLPLIHSLRNETDPLQTRHHFLLHLIFVAQSIRWLQAPQCICFQTIPIKTDPTAFLSLSRSLRFKQFYLYLWINVLIQCNCRRTAYNNKYSFTRYIN